MLAATFTKLKPRPNNDYSQLQKGNAMPENDLTEAKEAILYYLSAYRRPISPQWLNNHFDDDDLKTNDIEPALEELKREEKIITIVGDSLTIQLRQNHV